MHLPLSASALSPEECWSSDQIVTCSCGELHLLFDKRCKRCRLKNPAQKLFRRQRHVERWIARRVHPIGLKLDGANRLLSNASKLDGRFSDILSRSFPIRQRQEALNLFLRRAVVFLESLLKATAPPRLARELDTEIRRTAELFASIAWQEVRALVSEALGQAAPPPNPVDIARQTEVLQREFSGHATAYVQALQNLQVFHGRLVDAFRAARPILAREHKEGGVRGLWNWARRVVKPTGKLVDFGTAVWSNDAERRCIERIDVELMQFREQIERFHEQYLKLKATEAAALQAQTLSLQKWALFALTSELCQAEPAKRAELVRRFLSQKGVGSFWWRLRSK